MHPKCIELELGEAERRGKKWSEEKKERKRNGNKTRRNGIKRNNVASHLSK